MNKDFHKAGPDLSVLEAQMAKVFDDQTVPFAKAIPGLDLHMITAALMFGTRYDLVTTSQRASAKSRSFGVMYDPKAKWQVPPEEQLMPIYSDDQKADIAKELGVEVKDLYQAIVKKFGGNQ